jgi:hypothetical protein
VPGLMWFQPWMLIHGPPNKPPRILSLYFERR